MENLSFSFPIYARAIATRITQFESQKSFVIGVSGPWGSGKTTLMNTVINNLEEQHFSFTFNAWAHSKQDVVWRSFFVALITALRNELANNKQHSSDEIEGLLDDSERALYNAFTKEAPGQIEIDAGNLTKTGAKLALKFVPWGDTLSAVTKLLFDNKSTPTLNASTEKAEAFDEANINDLWGIFKRSTVKHHVARIESLEQFRKGMEDVLKHFVSPNRKLIVAIDDVDRCLPEQGLEVFEAIKLFLDLPDTIFLVAMDQGVLQHALDLRYKQGVEEGAGKITAELYAEKMIDLHFAIPSPSALSFRSFIDKNLPINEMLGDFFEFICSGLPRNPRTWVRFSHRAALRCEIIKELSAAGGIPISFDEKDIQAAFLKLEVLWFRWPQTMRILDNFQNFILLEKAAIEAKPKSSDFRKKLTTINNVESVFKESTAEDITKLGAPYGAFNELALLQFISQEPHLSKNVDTFKVFEALFTLDLQEEISVIST